MKEWFTAAEIASVPGMPDDPESVVNIAAHEKWLTDRRADGEFEFHLKSLPAEVQFALLTEMRKPAL